MTFARCLHLRTCAGQTNPSVHRVTRSSLLPGSVPVFLARRISACSYSPSQQWLHRLEAVGTSPISFSSRRRHVHTERSERRGMEKAKSTQARFPLLRQILALAAKSGQGPPLHTEENDVAFVPSSHRSSFDWLLMEDADSPSSMAADLASLRKSVFWASRWQADHEVTITKKLKFIQYLIAKRLSPRLPGNPLDAGPRVKYRHTLALAKHGYSLEDLDTWVTILTARDGDQAAELLTVTRSTPYPHFLYLYALRRHHLSAPAVRLLLAHFPAWYASVEVSYDSKHVSCRDTTALFNSVVFRAYVRLLRHVRRAWPQALESLALTLTTFIRLPSHLQGDNEHIARLAAIFNRAIYLTSEPAEVEPFQGVVYQEAAHAVLLRHMAEHAPPLVINREGYQGVLRVQLYKPKTRDEMEWARLKSPSWPPWKEDRTGIDADIPLDYGISRAHHVLLRMQEAGYHLRKWESVAMIYTGWDTDRSPTIQTRALMADAASDVGHSDVWAARVRSTSTVQQAWACFLSCQDESPEAVGHQVFLAMFEKLVADRKRVTLGLKQDEPDPGVEPLYPGDMTEAFPLPHSVHQETYTRTPVPSLEELHGRMLDSGLAPSGRTLAFLVQSAQSLSEGLSFLESSVPMHESLVPRFCHDDVSTHSFSDVPDAVFAATISLLCRFPHTFLERGSDGGPTSYTYGQHVVNQRQTLARAMYVLDKTRRQYRPAWNVLLRALARRAPPAILAMSSGPQRPKSPDDLQQAAMNKMDALELAHTTLRKMREIDISIDAVCFRHYCIITENAALAAAHTHATYQGVSLASIDTFARKLIDGANITRQATEFVRAQFWGLVGVNHGQLPEDRDDASDRALPRLPRLLNTPSAPVLHHFVRALGFLRDYDGLKELVHWMRTYWPELSNRKAEARNGDARMRRLVVALRVFLEGTWDVNLGFKNGGVSRDGDGSLDTGESPGASDEILDEVRAVVESVAEWGGWPTDEEVEIYMERM